MAARPVASMARVATRRRLRILAYHAVHRTESFDDQMAHLRSRYNPVGAFEVKAALGGLSDLPDLAVWVTFDDGDPSVVENALPVLVKYRIPATVFICPSVIDTTQPLWWQEVEGLLAVGTSIEIDDVAYRASRTDELVARMKVMPNQHRLSILNELRAQQGVADTIAVPQMTTEQLEQFVAAGGTIGNHTWSHPCLDRCTNETQEQEISQAHRWIAERFPDAPRMFAYPNGNWSAHAQHQLAAFGYDLALLFDHRVSPVSGAPLAVSRLRTNDTNSADRFSAILSGVHPKVHRIRRRVSGTRRNRRMR